MAGGTKPNGDALSALRGANGVEPLAGGDECGGSIGRGACGGGGDGDGDGGGGGGGCARTVLVAGGSGERGAGGALVLDAAHSWWPSVHVCGLSADAAPLHSPSHAPEQQLAVPCADTPHQGHAGGGSGGAAPQLDELHTARQS
jgi:hypothetical protein